ncbi:hypothetical protein [Nocardioides insulae]|uniref:hypothetical protein n=1 Tax=Nocardioides insulae TaxID=394734 RepID=UPI00040AC625|nr:hypothetical protein [Nocardioides insulae]
MPSSTRPAVASVLGAAAGLIALLTVLLAAFTWPISELAPRDLPVVVAGPEQAVHAVEQGLAEGGSAEDALALHRVDDRAAAVDAIQDRDAYGAVVTGPNGPSELLIASGASPVVARMLTQQLSAGSPGLTVTDVVPPAEGDPTGSVFGAGALPLALGGIAVGAVTSMLLSRTRDRVACALLVAAGSGLALTGILWGWLDVLGGGYWANAGVVSLGVLAVALPIIGLRHLIGPAGIAVIALLVLLVGNPLSGVTSAPELLPLGWLGQLLPPGAVGSALRSTAYFDGAGVGVPLVVLGAWSLLGLALTLVPRREARTDQPAPATPVAA